MKWKGSILAATALVITIAVCVTVLIALGKDPSVLLTALIPVVLIFVQSIKTDEVHQDVKKVQEQVNGRMSQLIDSKTLPETVPENPTTAEDGRPI